MREATRPQFHITPPQGWMNDPNGLIYHQGTYHLYFQHHPQAPKFGKISWGHATSTDLKNWKHRPIALEAYENVSIYSGCTVFDQQNLLEQEAASIAAIYTEHVGAGEDYSERICLAISQDGGFSFNQKERKIVLERDAPDFRDPKVFFHQESARWKMVVASSKTYEVLIYESSDLLNWEFCSAFYHPEPHQQYWECPDLFLMLDESGKEHWVMSISGSNADLRTWGMFYFLGSFDGRTFQVDTGPLWLDQGMDFYAGITFENHAEHRIMMAWCGNWAYATSKHPYNWRGIMSSPRKLVLRRGRLQHQLITDNRPRLLRVNEVLESQKTHIKVDSLEDRFLVERVWLGQTEQYEFEKTGSLIVYEDVFLVEIVDEVGSSFTFLSDPLAS